jgi:hypothetical protein
MVLQISRLVVKLKCKNFYRLRLGDGNTEPVGWQGVWKIWLTKVSYKKIKAISLACEATLKGFYKNRGINFYIAACGVISQKKLFKFNFIQPKVKR